MGECQQYNNNGYENGYSCAKHKDAKYDPQKLPYVKVDMSRCIARKCPYLRQGGKPVFPRGNRVSKARAHSALEAMSIDHETEEKIAKILKGNS